MRAVEAMKGCGGYGGHFEAVRAVGVCGRQIGAVGAVR